MVTAKGIQRRDELEPQAEIIAKILVVKGSKSKFVNAHVVPVKGLGSDRYAVEKLRRDIVWLGYINELSLKPTMSQPS